MGVSNFDDLSYHVGHEFECVFYGEKERNWNVSLECMTCGQVIIDFDNEEVDRPYRPMFWAGRSIRK